MPVEAITTNGRVLCYLIRQAEPLQATTFFTPPECSLQVGFVVHPAGHEIARHVHVPFVRQMKETAEVLLVWKGRCDMDVYDDAQRFVATTVLQRGDLLVMVGGGHAFRMIEDTVLLEVKQGPYPGPQEKELF